MSKWLLILLLSVPGAFASFSENSRRYLSPKDMFTLLNQKFPVLQEKEHLARYYLPSDKIPLSCWGLGLRNGNSSGLVLPAIGVPAASSPGTAFVRWWGSCADQIVHTQLMVLENLKLADQGLWSRYYAPEVIEKYRDKGNAKEPFHRLTTEKWKDLPPKLKQAQIRFLIEELIGPNAVVADLGFAKGIDDLAATIQTIVPDDSEMKISHVNRALLTGVILREEFITY